MDDLNLHMNLFGLTLNLIVLAPLFSLISLLCINFYVRYIRPAKRVTILLGDLKGHIEGLATSSKEVVLPEESDDSVREHTVLDDPQANIKMPEKIGHLFEKFRGDKTFGHFEHLWQEYRDTLHTSKSDSGEFLEIRATSSGANFFTKDAMVDLVISAHFYKHLPGILTGLGIIATFCGLVLGLNQFDYDRAETLPKLISEVLSAFVGSGFAILIAIVVTWFEKSAIKKCYVSLDAFVRALDDRFREGVGEEYLQRLVLATERNSVATQALKDSLVTDLRELMNEVADRQIYALETGNTQISDSIGRAIRDNLRDPLEKIAATVDKASGQQSEAVGGLLENLMTAFMDKLEHTVGDQLKESSAMMARVQDSLTKLVTDISGAGQAAADSMSQQLEAAMTRAADAQDRMNAQLREFVIELKSIVADQQLETKSRLEDMLISLQEDFKLRQAQANSERVEMAEEGSRRIAEISDGAKAAYEGLTSTVEELVRDLSNIANLNAENIAAIQNVSTEAISGMSGSAVRIGESSQKFTEAADSVSTVFDRSQSLMQNLESLSTTMGASSEALQNVLSDYQAARSTVTSLIIDLTKLAEQVKQENANRGDTLGQVSELLGAVENFDQQNKQNFEQMIDQLSRGFEEFGNNMITQVQRISKEADETFGRSLSVLKQSLDQLASQADDLKETADDLTEVSERFSRAD